MSDKSDNFKLTPQIDDKGRWSLIDWDNMNDTTIVRVVEDRLHASSSHKKRTEAEEKWKENYKYYKGTYDDEDTLKNRNIFTIIEAKLAKLYRMGFHEKPIIRVSPDDPDSTAKQAEKIETLFHHQIDKCNPNHNFSAWLKQGLLNGTGVFKAGWKTEKKAVYDRIVKDGKTYVDEENPEIKITGRPYFSVPDIYDVYPDMNAKSPDDISYVVEIKRVRLSELLNSGDVYMNLEKVVEVAKSGKITKKSDDTIKKELSDDTSNADESGKPYEGAETISDEFDPIVKLYIYYEKDRVVVIANEAVVIRNEPNPFWHKEIPFIFSQNYLDFETVYGISDVEPISALEEAGDQYTQFTHDYGKVGLRHKIFYPETLSIDEEAMTDADNSIVYCEDPSQVKELAVPNINVSSGLALVQTYKEKQEEASAMTAQQKGAPVRQETAAGVYSIQEAGNTRFLYIVDQSDHALAGLAEWFRVLNYQYMPDSQRIEKRNSNGEDEWITITPEDLKGKFKYSFVGSSNAENKDLQYLKIKELYGMLVGRPDIDQDYLLETLIRKSGAFDNPEKLINSKKTEAGNRMGAIQQAAAQEGGIPPMGNPNPAEQQRLDISKVNNPNNSFNGGEK